MFKILGLKSSDSWHFALRSFLKDNTTRQSEKWGRTTVRSAFEDVGWMVVRPAVEEQCMTVTRREFLAALSATTVTGALAACGGHTAEPEQAATSAATQDAPSVDLAEFRSLKIDMKAWHYDAEHAVWWQVGLAYCTKPATTTYEKLGMYVPGAYLKPTDEKADLEAATTSKTFECELNPTGTVGAYTCASAPVVMPINAPDFAAQDAPASYLNDGLDPYLSAGFVYVYAGCRGSSNGYDSSSSGEGFFSGGAPWAVCDLKAAVRYLRYNQEVLPGNMERIVTFGHAAGGLLSAIMGATGNAPAYVDYLAKIGAATHDAQGNEVGDVVAACACWCPEPPANAADAAYEWELGQFCDADTRAEGTWTKLASSDLALTYAAYLNGLALHEGETQFSLDETEGGIFTDGSYYERLVSIVEDAATSFFSSTAFPHAIDPTDISSGNFPGSGEKPLETDVTSVGSTEAGAVATVAPITYASRGDYISSLNAAGHWLTYNESKGTVRIADLGSFVRACRAPTLPACAFDSTTRSAPGNQLFGNDDSDSLHFSQQISDLLSSRSGIYEQAGGWDQALPGDWAGDLAKSDALGKPMKLRRDMYDPLYFLSGASEGFQSSVVAEHWRINLGLAETTAPAISAATNLALALSAYGGTVQDVSFTPVWGVGCKLAELGDADPTAALVSWVCSLFPFEEVAATTQQ